MMRITTVLPVSRTNYLDRVVDSIKNQTHAIDKIIVVLEGVEQSQVEGLFSGFKDVRFVVSGNAEVAKSILDRRRNISNIHNRLRSLIGDDWVLSVEDDGILPPGALEDLIANKNILESEGKNVGIVSGVELGRWGLPYVGAWRSDSIEEPRKLISLARGKGVEKIDACGLYCALIRADVYRSHQFDCINGLGPDVNLGLFARQQGYVNYVNWGVPVTHLTNSFGLEMEIYATDNIRQVSLTRMSGDVWQSGD